MRNQEWTPPHPYEKTSPCSFLNKPKGIPLSGRAGVTLQQDLFGGPQGESPFTQLPCYSATHKPSKNPRSMFQPR